MRGYLVLIGVVYLVYGCLLLVLISCFGFTYLIALFDCSFNGLLWLFVFIVCWLICLLRLGCILMLVCWCSCYVLGSLHNCVLFVFC